MTQRFHSLWTAARQLSTQRTDCGLDPTSRQRDRLLEYAGLDIQHMQKALTEMNLQLHHVVADITGATGLRIIRAILAGEPTLVSVAALAPLQLPLQSETIAKRACSIPRRASVALEQALAALHRLPREGIGLRRADRSRVEGTEHPSRS